MRFSKNSLLKLSLCLLLVCLVCGSVFGDGITFEQILAADKNTVESEKTSKNMFKMDDTSVARISESRYVSYSESGGVITTVPLTGKQLSQAIATYKDNGGTLAPVETRNLVLGVSNGEVINVNGKSWIRRGEGFIITSKGYSTAFVDGLIKKVDSDITNPVIYNNEVIDGIKINNKIYIPSSNGQLKDMSGKTVEFSSLVTDLDENSYDALPDSQKQSANSAITNYLRSNEAGSKKITSGEFIGFENKVPLVLNQGKLFKFNSDASLYDETQLVTLNTYFSLSATDRQNLKIIGLEDIADISKIQQGSQGYFLVNNGKVNLITQTGNTATATQTDIVVNSNQEVVSSGNTFYVIDKVTNTATPWTIDSTNPSARYGSSTPVSVATSFENGKLKGTFGDGDKKAVYKEIDLSGTQWESKINCNPDNKNCYIGDTSNGQLISVDGTGFKSANNIQFKSQNGITTVTNNNNNNIVTRRTSEYLMDVTTTNAINTLSYVDLKTGKSATLDSNLGSVPADPDNLNNYIKLRDSAFEGFHAKGGGNPDSLAKVVDGNIEQKDSSAKLTNYGGQNMVFSDDGGSYTLSPPNIEKFKGTGKYVDDEYFTTTISLDKDGKRVYEYSGGVLGNKVDKWYMEEKDYSTYNKIKRVENDDGSYLVTRFNDDREIGKTVTYSMNGDVIKVGTTEVSYHKTNGFFGLGAKNEPMFKVGNGFLGPDGNIYKTAKMDKDDIITAATADSKQKYADLQKDVEATSEANRLAIVDEAFRARNDRYGIDSSQERFWDKFLSFKGSMDRTSGFYGAFMDADELAEKEAEYMESALGKWFTVQGLESSICDMVEEIPAADGEGVGIVNLPGGVSRIGATIQGKKQQITYFNDDFEEITEYIYKITYTMRNPNPAPEDDGSNGEKDWQYNVHLKGETNVHYWEPDRIVKAGGSESFTKSNMITFYSQKNYDKLCIVFATTPEGMTSNEVCNVIVDESNEEETDFTYELAAEQSSTTEASGGSSSSGSGSEEPSNPNDADGDGVNDNI